MTIDVIICTFNRPQKASNLVAEIMLLCNHFNQLIVVDSSDSDIEELKNKKKIAYIKSSHKNQPYQRYVGMLASDSDLLLYLDDDMELVDLDFFEKIQSIFTDSKIVAQSLYWENKPGALNSQIELNQYISKKKGNGFIKCLTFSPNPVIGGLGHCGIRGKYPDTNGRIEFLSGGSFVVRRKVIFKDFNFQLFNLFEDKLGMGEDSIIGFSLSKHGHIYFERSLFFYHNDEGTSSYINNMRNFQKRVTFSRKFLTLERSRLNGESLLKGNLYFHFYTMFRLVALVAKMKNGYRNKDRILGLMEGWILARKFKFHFDDKDRVIWNQRALNDIKKK